MVLVLLVRHGQASFGADDYDVLTEAGLEQSRILGRSLAGQGLAPAAVVHGRLRRQRDTAAAIVGGGGWAVTPEVDEGWDEFDHVGMVARGGTPGEDVTDPRVFQRLFDEVTVRWSSGGHDEEYDEPWPAFLRRTDGALDRAFARAGLTVAVSSGGPIGVVCARMIDPVAPPDAVARLWRSFSTVTVNASVTRVLEGPSGRRLLSFNEHAHLPRDLITYR